MEGRTRTGTSTRAYHVLSGVDRRPAPAPSPRRRGHQGRRRGGGGGGGGLELQQSGPLVDPVHWRQHLEAEPAQVQVQGVHGCESESAGRPQGTGTVSLSVPPAAATSVGTYDMHAVVCAQAQHGGYGRQRRTQSQWCMSPE